MTQEEFLRLCAEGTYADIVDAIISGFDPSEKIFIKDTPAPAMFIAVSAGNKDTVEALAVHDVDCSDGFTAAVVSENMDMAEFLIELGGDINAPDQSGHNALLTAVTMNRPDLVEKLIELGADVNSKADGGYSALSYAAMSFILKDYEDTHPQIIKLLMENDADYFEAMLIAIRTDNKKFAKLLLDYGADIDLQDEEGRSFLMHSVMNEGKLLQTFLSYGPNPDRADHNGRTPLIIAVIDEELDSGVIDALLDYGADIDRWDFKGITPLMWAVAGVNKMPDIFMPMLIRMGGIKFYDFEKLCAFIALYISARHEQQLYIVQHLVDCGADVNRTDKRGMNALMYAMMNGDDESADILMNAGAAINFDMI